MPSGMGRGQFGLEKETEIAASTTDSTRILEVIDCLWILPKAPNLSDRHLCIPVRVHYRYLDKFISVCGSCKVTV
jgi:hypothetical protein